MMVKFYSRFGSTEASRSRKDADSNARAEDGWVLRRRSKNVGAEICAQILPPKLNLMDRESMNKNLGAVARFGRGRRIKKFSENRTVHGCTNSGWAICKNVEVVRTIYIYGIRMVWTCRWLCDEHEVRCGQTQDTVALSYGFADPGSKSAAARMWCGSRSSSFPSR